MTLRRPDALRALIRAHGWSDGAFAKLIGCHRTTVNSYLTGRRTHIDDETVTRMLEVLGDTRDILFASEASPVEGQDVPVEGSAA